MILPLELPKMEMYTTGEKVKIVHGAMKI